ncbi:MAG: flippase-like domain-containing protein [Desulfobacteraceae bacterium]|nr:flippase-like domain-containing protein [Desulfobacteraceae bacterium]
MKIAAALLWMAGLALLIGLVAYQGFTDVGSALAEAGWGILAVTACYPFGLLTDTIGWRLLLPAGVRPRLRAMLGPRWICDAVNFLLPAAQLGGDLVRARLLAWRGIPASQVGASVVVDIVTGVATEILFALLGVFFLIRYEGFSRTTMVVAASMLLFIVLVATFFLMQHFGLFRRVTRLASSLVRVGNWDALIGNAAALDDAITATYRRRRELFHSSLWRLLGWFLGVVEVWLALHFLGHPVGVGQAVMLESLGQAIRHAFFVVPGALGVQEAGFILLGTVVGIRPEIGLSISLIKRVREILIGLPALLLWQLQEGRRLIRRKN